MRYLFRLDMAKDNDDFVNLRRALKVDCVYSGSPMKVGSGWIPDFVEVEIEPDATICRLTLIELEATEISARASCRKYLPESSRQVLQVFLGYLDTVISQCRSTADPRLNTFEELKAHFATVSTMTVRTAGALRTSADLVEDLALIDQPERFTPAVTGSAQVSPSSFSFQGDRRLTRAESDGIRRAVRIIHAVVVGRDHSGGTMKSWRNLRQKPLDRAVAKERLRYPDLHRLLTSKTEFGLRVNCDKLAAELALLWRIDTEPMTAERVRSIVSAFSPEAVTFAEHVSMQKVFDRAREIIRETAV